MKDLTPIIKAIEEVLKEWYETDKKLGMAIAFTLPNEYKDVHWITNLNREDGILLLETTAQKMKDFRRDN